MMTKPLAALLTKSRSTCSNSTLKRRNDGVRCCEAASVLLLVCDRATEVVEAVTAAGAEAAVAREHGAVLLLLAG